MKELLDQMVGNDDYCVPLYRDREMPVNDICCLGLKLWYFLQASWEIPERKPDPKWPQEGKVDVEELCLKYRDDLAPALNNISFSIKSSEKVKTISQYFANMYKYKQSLAEKEIFL